MVFALSTGHEIGLALTGAIFIVFALISSFVLPSRDPNFPGRGRNWYVLLCVAFFAAMMSAVVVFGREKKEPTAEAATGTKTSTTPTKTQPAAGNAAAGKTTFASSGCGACHTFKPAGSNGKVGPDLDHVTADAAKAKQPLDQYITTSIEDPNAYIVPGFPAAMPKLPLSSSQVADLVAFLSSGQ
jgi:mono/diheme cytochrome c family protein